MKIEIRPNSGIVTVTREQGDKKYYGIGGGKAESLFLHDLKKELNRQGYDLIKKRMWRDGHLVDDMQQYLRTRKKGAGKADIYIHNGCFALWDAGQRFNEGEVALTLTTDVFK